MQKHNKVSNKVSNKVTQKKTDGLTAIKKGPIDYDKNLLLLLNAIIKQDLPKVKCLIEVEKTPIKVSGIMSGITKSFFPTSKTPAMPLSPIDLAVIVENTKIIDYLLDIGCDIPNVNALEKNLRIKISNETKKHLVDAQKRVKNIGGHKKLRKAVHDNNLAEVEKLLQNKICPNHCSAYGDTYFILAAQNRNLKIMGLLYKFGANPYIYNTFGINALYWLHKAEGSKYAKSAESIEKFARKLKLEEHSTDKVKKQIIITYYEKGNGSVAKGDFKKAFKFYNIAIERAKLSSNPSMRAKLYVARAEAYCRISKYQKAKEDCTLALKLDKQCPEAYLTGALAKDKLGEVNTFVWDKNLIRPNNKDSSGINLYWDLATSYFYAKNYKAAIENYSKAIKLNPRGNLYTARGEANFFAKEYGKALIDFLKALKYEDYSCIEPSKDNDSALVLCCKKILEQGKYNNNKELIKDIKLLISQCNKTEKNRLPYNSDDLKSFLSLVHKTQASSPDHTANLVVPETVQGFFNNSSETFSDLPNDMEKIQIIERLESILPVTPYRNYGTKDAKERFAFFKENTPEDLLVNLVKKSPPKDGDMMFKDGENTVPKRLLPY